MRLLVVLGLLSVLTNGFHLKSARGRVRAERESGLQMLQEGDEGFESRRGARVPIDKIGSMFDDNTILPGIISGSTDAGNSQFYDDEDDDEEEEEEKSVELEAPAVEEVPVVPVDEVLTQRLIIEPIPPPRIESSFDMGDLVAMETQAKLEGSGALDEEEVEVSSVTSSSAVSNESVDYSSVGEEESSLEDELYDLSLSKALDSNRAATVRRSMSIKSSTAVRAGEQVRRVTKYDPNDFFRPDPMLYGAYRRWQVDNDEENDSRKATAGGKSATKSGGRGTGSKGKVKGEKPKKGGDTNSFYKAIKKLGSGPKGEGESTGTGVADPDKGMKNVDLGKAPPRTRRTKRTVTAKEIDSIFDDGSDDAGDEEEDYDDYQDEDTDMEMEAGVNSFGEGSSVSTVSPETPTPIDVASLNSFFDEPAAPVETSKAVAISGSSKEEVISMDTLASEEVPKWLKDADKDAKKALRAKAKKKKKLTDDWRFWAAIIASVGFVSAIFTMQGTNTNINDANPIEQQRERERSFNRKDYNNNNNIRNRNGEPDELVI